MKYILIFLVVLILSSALVKYCGGSTISDAFRKKVAAQQNPFTMHKKEGAVAWQRAEDFFHQMKHLYTGGPFHKDDSIMYIPYVPGLSYHRGDSIAVVKKDQGDSVIYRVSWSSYDRPDSFSANEIAYYMVTGITRYDRK